MSRQHMHKKPRSYTGPIQPTKRQMEKWYHRTKDFLTPIHRQGYGIAVHPKDEGLIRDLLEQLLEDPTWPHDDVPPMVVATMGNIAQGEIRPVDTKTLNVVAMRQMLGSSTGFGRFGGLMLPDGHEGLHNPWRVPKGVTQRVITPDDPNYSVGGSVR